MAGIVFVLYSPRRTEVKILSTKQQTEACLHPLSARSVCQAPKQKGDHNTGWCGSAVLVAYTTSDNPNSNNCVPYHTVPY